MVRAMRVSSTSPVDRQRSEMQRAEIAVVDEAVRLSKLTKQNMELAEGRKRSMTVNRSLELQYKTFMEQFLGNFQPANVDYHDDIDEAFFPALKINGRGAKKRLSTRQHQERRPTLSNFVESSSSSSLSQGLQGKNEVETPPGSPTTAADDAPREEDNNNTAYILSDLKRQKKISAKDDSFRFYCPVQPCTNTYSSGNGLSYHAKNYHSEARKNGRRSCDPGKVPTTRKRKEPSLRTTKASFLVGKKESSFHPLPEQPFQCKEELPEIQSASSPQRQQFPIDLWPEVKIKPEPVTHDWNSEIKLEPPFENKFFNFEQLNDFVDMASIKVMTEPEDVDILALFNGDHPNLGEVSSSDIDIFNFMSTPLVLKTEKIDIKIESISDAELNELYEQMMGPPYQPPNDSFMCWPADQFQLNPLLPIKIEPIKIEPIQIEPIKIEPIQIEPIKIEQIKIEPIEHPVSEIRSIQHVSTAVTQFEDTFNPIKKLKQEKEDVYSFSEIKPLQPFHPNSLSASISNVEKQIIISKKIPTPTVQVPAILPNIVLRNQKTLGQNFGIAGGMHDHNYAKSPLSSEEVVHQASKQPHHMETSDLCSVFAKIRVGLTSIPPQYEPGASTTLKGRSGRRRTHHKSRHNDEDYRYGRFFK